MRAPSVDAGDDIVWIVQAQEANASEQGQKRSMTGKGSEFN